MSDNGAAPATTATAVEKKGPWSDSEKYELLLQIIGQIAGDRPTIKWAEINMPGRTVKAMTHTWTKIRAEVTASKSGGGEGEDKPAAAKPKPTPRKKKTEAAPDGEPTPKKKRAPPKKKVKKEESGDEPVVATPDAGDNFDEEEY